MDSSVGEELVRSGTITKSDALLAQMVRRHCDASLDRIQSAAGLASEHDLLAAHARRLRTKQLDADEVADAPLTFDRMDPRLMLRHGFVPLNDSYQRPIIVTSDADHLRAANIDWPFDMAGAQRVLAPRDAIQARVAEEFRADLTLAAQERVPEVESCRTWGDGLNRRLILTIGSLGVLCALTLAFPTAVFSLFVFWAMFTLIVTAGMKTAAFVASLSASDPEATSTGTKKDPLPKVSILVPLFREKEILHALIARLSRLTYPKCLLDVVLVLEEEDTLTQETLAEIDLPSWIRPVVVPDGKPRTKPRAMNYALDFCEGDIIGIFDAEDAPDPDQITIIARRFQNVAPEVACLQGILDYYNPTQNWLARCFTIEYATWFRLMMPGWPVWALPFLWAVRRSIFAAKCWKNWAVGMPITSPRMPIWASVWHGMAIAPRWLTL